MRKIIFRGKRIDNGGWGYGDLIHSFGTVYVGNGDENKFLKELTVIPETVGQFTGLLDKNGKEIYEGDILSVVDPNGEENKLVVEWDEIGCCHTIEDNFDGYDMTTIGWAKTMGYEFYVVGNAYDNPELLK